MNIPCVICGTPFVAKRASARYCSERCKKRAQRNPGRPASGTLVPVTGLAPVRTLAPAVAPPASEATGRRVTAATEQKLAEAGRTDTPLGAVALVLAAKLDAPGLDTGSSIAALARELKATLAAALEGAETVETPLERMKRERARRAG